MEGPGDPMGEKYNPSTVQPSNGNQGTLVPRVWSRKQITEHFGISLQSVIRAEYAGKLRPHKIGHIVRYDESDVLAWFNGDTDDEA